MMFCHCFVVVHCPYPLLGTMISAYVLVATSLSADYFAAGAHLFLMAAYPVADAVKNDVGTFLPSLLPAGKTIVVLAWKLLDEANYEGGEVEIY